MLADEKESRRPPTIATAIELLQRCFTIFGALAGRDANDLAAAMYVDRPIAMMSWDAIDPNWIRRFLRPTGLQLPGHSRTIVAAQKSADGKLSTAPVREPAPRVAAEVRMR